MKYCCIFADITKVLSLLKERKVYIDLLRVLAIFFVVLLHVSAVNFSVTNVKGYEWAIMNFYDSACRWAIPCFVMISGVFFLDNAKPLTFKKLYSKYILRIVCALLFFSLIYALINNFLFWKSNDMHLFWVSFVNGYYHLWFLYMILGLYIVAPVIRNISISKKLSEYFLILFFLIVLIFPLIESWFDYDYMRYPLSKINLSMFGGFVGYWLLGFYLNKYYIGKKTKIALYILAPLALCFTIIATAVLSYQSGEADGRWYEYLGLNVALMSCGVFVFFKEKVSKIHFSQKAEKIILFLSKNSFGIYLVHAFFLDLLRYNGISSLSFNPWISIPAITIFVFAISVFTAWIMKKIPILGDYIL